MNFEKLAQSNIMETLGIAGAPEEERKGAIEDATDVIMQSAMDRVMDGLTDEESLDFERVFGEDASEEERAAFLKKHVPNLDEILIQESLRYKALAEVMASSSREKDRETKE